MGRKCNGVVENEFGSTGWQASCSCGWAGTNGRSEAAALTELKDHYAATDAPKPAQCDGGS